jgi:acetyl-CoA carboxylase biotin carboxyl carrier protein
MNDKQIKRAIDTFRASDAQKMTLEYEEILITLQKKEHRNTSQAKTITIVSPVVGIVSLTINNGSTLVCNQVIKKEDVICFIESMKMLRNITSDVNGVIDEIYVNHLDMVEYNQPLVKIKIDD